MRSSSQQAAEAREGSTYESGCGYLPTKELDIEHVPAAKPLPCLEKIGVPSPTLVFHDVETTSLAFQAEIVQLAACCGQKTLNRFVMPGQPISKGASKVTGITKERQCGKDVLCQNGKIVSSTTCSAALTDFTQ